jgi:aromatic ring-opening dioxygenase catalytic subunit (LigB family)
MKGPTVLFVSHGGGPMPILGDPSHDGLRRAFDQIGQQLSKPKNIVIVTAHWESDAIRVTAQPTPDLLYDYYGFPEQAYRLSYPAVGNPPLAESIVNALTQQNITATQELERGWDHGVFVPAMLLFPKADVPVISISLNANLDPETHLTLGEALRGVLKEDDLLIGSGFSFHNLGLMRNGQSADVSTAFTHWLDETLVSESLSYEQQRQRMVRWMEAPAARSAHPREEHLLPLHVCFGAATGLSIKPFAFDLMSADSRCYLWQ